MEKEIRIDIAPGFARRIKKEDIPKYYRHAKYSLYIAIIFYSCLCFFIISSILGYDIIPDIHWVGNIFVSLLFIVGLILAPFWAGWLSLTPYFYYKYAKRNYEEYNSGNLSKR